MKKTLKNLNSPFFIIYFKIATLAHYLSKNQMKEYVGCDFEFDVDAKTGRFERLHVWRGKDHNYQEEYHEIFEVPSKFIFSRSKYFNGE